MLYDGYTHFVYYWVEALGFCGEGEAHSFIQGGRIEQGGALPLNTFGGSSGEGRLHGFGQVREAAQVMGAAPATVRAPAPTTVWSADRKSVV